MLLEPLVENIIDFYEDDDYDVADDDADDNIHHHPHHDHHHHQWADTRLMDPPVNVVGAPGFKQPVHQCCWSEKGWCDEEDHDDDDDHHHNTVQCS